MWKLRAMKIMSFTVFSYNATVLLIQPNPTHHMCWKMRSNPTHGCTQPMSSVVLLKMEVGIRKRAWQRDWRYPAYLWSLRWVYAVKRTREVGICRIPAYTPQYTTAHVHLWPTWLCTHTHQHTRTCIVCRPIMCQHELTRALRQASRKCLRVDASTDHPKTHGPIC